MTLRVRQRISLLIGLALMLVIGFRLLAPGIIGDRLISIAVRSPGITDLPVIGDVILDRLGSRLTDPAGESSDVLRVSIAEGSGTGEIANQLLDAGLIGDEAGFIIAVHRAGLDGLLQAGDFLVAPAMTPTEVAAALTTPYREPTVAVALRAGIRLEQEIGRAHV